MVANAKDWMILRVRDLFEVPERYFLSHSVGCLPKSSQQALSDGYFKPWGQFGGKAWPAWLSTLEDYRSKIGVMLGAPSEGMCPQTNISSALTKILYSLPKHASRNVILLSPQDFPTNGFVFKQAERSGYKLKFVEGDITDPQVWNKAIDSVTAIVHITHALSNTSHLLPVKEICEMARQKEAVSIVDIAQSAGVVPIDVMDWKADFAIGTGVKFLCCGPGACFLYASKQMLENCTPVDVGWFSHENPFEMDIRDFRYADDAMKFFGGTPSPAPFVLANESLSLLQHIGHRSIYETIQTSLSVLIEGLPKSALKSPQADSARGATLVVAPPDRDALREALKIKNILHDERAEGFRFSVHAYTSSSDLDVLRHAIKQSY